MPVSSYALIVSVLWRYSVVEAAVVSENVDVMNWILKYSASGLFISKEGYMFSVTKEYYESTGSKDSTESSSVDKYMSLGTEVEIPPGIILIALILMSIYPECDSECLSRKKLDYSHGKNYGSVGSVYYGEETDSFDEAINKLYGRSWFKFTPGPLKNTYQIYQSNLQYEIIR